MARGADVTARGRYDGTPLTLAYSIGDAATAAELLRLGADVNAQNNVGRSALMWAAVDGHAAAVRVLLAVPGIDIINGLTALSWARSNGHAAAITLLEASGAHAH